MGIRVDDRPRLSTGSINDRAALGAGANAAVPREAGTDEADGRTTGRHVRHGRAADSDKLRQGPESFRGRERDRLAVGRYACPSAMPDSARRYEGPSQRVNELRLLYRVSTELNAAQGKERVLEVTLDTMDEVFGFTHGSVYLLDAESSVLGRAASRGECSRPEGERTRIGRGMVGAAAAKRKVVRVNLSANPLEPVGIHQAFMAVPMLTRDTLVGVLYLQTGSERPLLKQDEVLVTIVANQAAVALQNAELFEHLEARVGQRTQELATANRELRETQAQLVQSGKMAALGQLAAGLAHEMNTPLGAIRSNADLVERALVRLRGAVEDAGVVDDASTTLEAPPHRRVLAALAEANRITREASARLFTIFRTLRSFARLDEATLQWADLHDGLDSTLALLEHRLGSRIEVVRDYGAIPRVRCHASEINQVFLIALNNAIEAIDGSGSITVRTRTMTGLVNVEIEDTGRGVPPEHLDRVFDPGFTTKGVRVGTGLSLGIAFRILEQHRGRISLDSSEGRGTTVTLELPLVDDGQRA